VLTTNRPLPATNPGAGNNGSVNTTVASSFLIWLALRGRLALLLAVRIPRWLFAHVPSPCAALRLFVLWRN